MGDTMNKKSRMKEIFSGELNAQRDEADIQWRIKAGANLCLLLSKALGNEHYFCTEDTEITR
jgi:hypothetical protein